MWTLLWIVPSTSWEWTSCNFVLPPKKEKQGLLYQLARRQEVPMEYSLRLLWPVTACHPWFAHLQQHKHFSTLQWCLGPESQSVVMSGFQKHLTIFVCKGDLFPMTARGFSSVLKCKAPFLLYKCFLGTCAIRSQDLAHTLKCSWDLCHGSRTAGDASFAMQYMKGNIAQESARKPVALNICLVACLPPQKNSTGLHFRP